jgi:cation diffusion facilitator family transporter
MSGQCCQNQPKFDGVSTSFKRALWIVIAINGVMFVVEMIAGRISQSQALQADALDFFADTITYGLSLYVIGMSIKVRSSAALLKGLSLVVMGLWVLGSTVYQSFQPGVPQAEVMGLIGFLALLANLLSVLLLIRYRNGDANVRSAWLCSRNDAIGNIAVMLAGSGVWVTNSTWPDLVVASLMAGLFLWSALQIIRLAYEEYQSSV